eukprot:4657964-Amphidinium_carterae.1
MYHPKLQITCSDMHYEETAQTLSVQLLVLAHVPSAGTKVHDSMHRLKHNFRDSTFARFCRMDQVMY